MDIFCRGSPASFTAKGHPQTGQSESVILSQVVLLQTLSISSILSLDTGKITHTATSTTMGRPRINGQGKKRKSYQRAAVAYSHKQEILNYIESGHNLHETIEELYGKLQRKDLRKPFILTPPNRVDITEWISISWGNLSIETIVSGFAKVGILTDTRVAEGMPTEDAPQIESYIVEELENCNVVDGEVGSDDDIENESDTCSDDESNL
ncbi:unnamed protein product [Phytophthora fragariaefolia]|uniref:Unnamed protein product n=1 Tax=Phytophthora fragariaefolia TaxID=1490495 RepID=A0A9W7D793_9STRA|nr:unnamed protein product [Phytophthora fragariaefolia]